VILALTPTVTFQNLTEFSLVNNLHIFRFHENLLNKLLKLDDDPPIGYKFGELQSSYCRVYEARMYTAVVDQYSLLFAWGGTAKQGWLHARLCHAFSSNFKPVQCLVVDFTEPSDSNFVANHIETTSSENATTTCTANVRDVEGSDEPAVDVYQRPTDTCSVSFTQPTDVDLSDNTNTRKKKMG